MLKKLITIGTTTQNNKIVNGQSMMFQLFIDQLIIKNIQPIIVDFGISINNNFANRRISGKFSLIKLIDNFFLTFKFFRVLIVNPRVPIYINTSQSLVGFIRDYIFINLAKLFKRFIVAHQFGANYKNFYDSQSPFFQKIIRKTLTKTDYFIVEGDFTKKQMNFINNYQDKVISIPNGLPEKINTEKIFPKFIPEDNCITILYLSNLIESKGFWDILEAGNILQNTLNYKIKLIFAGKFLEDKDDKIAKNSHEAKNIFFQKLKEYNLENCTQYFEGLYGEEKSKIFSESHFFVLPSYYCNEGQPVSVLEAIAYGCVPIVTNYRLIPMMVNTELGFFVNPKSPEEISEKIAWCVNHKEEYHIKSANAIHFFKNNFTADKYISQILNIFKDAN